MRFVQGSHRLQLLPHRARDNDLENHGREVTIDPASLGPVVECPVRAGGVTIHFATTVHGSTPNLSREVRKAWAIHFDHWGRLGKYLPSALFQRFTLRS
jgi:ectoine hydroxylase-related dioxygenase (phytanoyl-CoA dioxygenase family)